MYLVLKVPREFARTLWPYWITSSNPYRCMSRSRDMGCYNALTALKFDKSLGNAAAEVPAKFQSDWKSLNPNLAASDFTGSCSETSVRLVNRCPEFQSAMFLLMAWHIHLQPQVSTSACPVYIWNQQVKFCYAFYNIFGFLFRLLKWYYQESP